MSRNSTPKGPTTKDLIGTFHAKTRKQKSLALRRWKEWCDSQGLRCLAKEFTERMEFECVACGHTWETYWGNVSRGRRCRPCSYQIRRMQRVKPEGQLREVRKRAASANLRLDSTTFENSKTALSFTCLTCNHSFERTPEIFKKTHRCPRCVIEANAQKLRTPIRDLQDEATRRGGALLSTEYRGCHRKYEWQCGNKHTFESSWTVVRKGSWCVECYKNSRESFGERLCRIFFEWMFEGHSFPTRQNLDWLRGEKTNHRLELDGFCEELGLGFEHQGIQHRKLEFGHMKGNLKAIQSRDRHKRRLIKQQGLSIIEVPHIGIDLDPEDVAEFIANKLRKHRFRPPKDWRKFRIPWKRAYTPRLKDHYQRLQEAASTLGLRVISSGFKGWHVRHEFKCKNRKHPRFQAPAARIVYPKGAGLGGCRLCSKERLSQNYRVPFETIKRIAEEGDSECLSKPEDYINEKTVLRFRHRPCRRVYRRTYQLLRRHGAICSHISCRRARLSRSRLP